MDLAYLTLIRLLIPLFILKWPLLGIIASMWVDSSDWHWYPFKNQSDYYTYQNWDKVLDFYYLGIAFYTTLWWHDFKARAISMFLFLYRAAGVILFSVTSNKIFLFLFPNVFETFFIFYFAYILITKNNQLFLPGEKGVILLAAISAPKVFQEYLLHFADVTATDLFGFGNALSFWTLFSVIVFIYVIILFWRIKLQKQSGLRYT